MERSQSCKKSIEPSFGIQNKTRNFFEEIALSTLTRRRFTMQDKRLVHVDFDLCALPKRKKRSGFPLEQGPHTRLIDLSLFSIPEATHSKDSSSVSFRGKLLTAIVDTLE